MLSRVLSRIQSTATSTTTKSLQGIGVPFTADERRAQLAKYDRDGPNQTDSRSGVTASGKAKQSRSTSLPGTFNKSKSSIASGSVMISAAGGPQAPGAAAPGGRINVLAMCALACPCLHTSAKHIQCITVSLTCRISGPKTAHGKLVLLVCDLTLFPALFFHSTNCAVNLSIRSH
jgi:hypothetical protein